MQNPNPTQGFTAPHAASAKVNRSAESTRTLLPEHAAQLRGISPEIVAERGYYSETSPLALQTLGIAPELSDALVPALAVPIKTFDIFPFENRFAVHIPASRNPHGEDYWQLPEDLTTCVDAYPDLRSRNLSSSLILTDRVDVADLFASLGYHSQALLRAERWRGGGGNGPDLLLGLRRARCRNIYLAFSCHVQSSKAHRKMLRCLTKQLVNFVRSCSLFEMRVPEDVGGRQSYRDYFENGGTVEELLQSADLIGQPIFNPRPKS